MRPASIAEVVAALPARFSTVVPWSSDAGDDCSAVRGQCCVLYFDEQYKLWFVQKYTTFDDASVGIFGEVEPGNCVFGDSDVVSAMRAFMTMEAEAEADERCAMFKQWLSSAERAEETKE